MEKSYISKGEEPKGIIPSALQVQVRFNSYSDFISSNYTRDIALCNNREYVGTYLYLAICFPFTHLAFNSLRIFAFSRLFKRSVHMMLGLYRCLARLSRLDTFRNYTYRMYVEWNQRFEIVKFIDYLMTKVHILCAYPWFPD